MSHKYLNKLGISSDNPCIFNTEDQCNEKWGKQRKKHGFDNREIYNLDFTLITWLYSHLKYYYKHTPVDLNFHCFNITLIDGTTRDVTEGEAIKEALRYMKHYLKDPYDIHSIDFDNCRYASCALRIVAEIFSSLWI